MASNSLLPSVIGNIVAQRERLSAVRQRLKLEPSPKAEAARLRELAPSPPTGPAHNPGAAATAVAQQPMMPVQEPTGLPPLQIPPEKEQAMLAMAEQFINQWGPQQQAMIDRQKQEQARQGQPQQVINDPGIVQALAPMAQFFRENGRLPTPDELRQVEAKQMLVAQLGRDPTPTEVELFLAKPPKGGTSK